MTNLGLQGPEDSFLRKFFESLNCPYCQSICNRGIGSTGGVANSVLLQELLALINIGLANAILLHLLDWNCSGHKASCQAI